MSKTFTKYQMVRLIADYSPYMKKGEIVEVERIADDGTNQVFCRKESGECWWALISDIVPAELEELRKKLPHGSGIDYDWTLRENKNFVYAENAYHYMNENGFYDGILPFTIRFPKDDMKNFSLHFHVNSAGRYRVNKGCVRDYIIDTICYYLFTK